MPISVPRLRHTSYQNRNKNKKAVEKKIAKKKFEVNAGFNVEKPVLEMHIVESNGESPMKSMYSTLYASK